MKTSGAFKAAASGVAASPQACSVFLATDAESAETVSKPGIILRVSVPRVTYRERKGKSCFFNAGRAQERV